MKTTVKSPLAARLAVLAMALFAIVGTCVLSAMGTAQNAWADSVPKPLFSSTVTALPFEKTDKGITVEIALEDPEADQASDSAAKPNEDPKDNAADDAAAAGDAASEAAEAAKATPASEKSPEAAPADEGSPAADPADDAAKKLSIKVTAEKDIDAEVLVVKAGDKDITKTIKGKVLKKDKTVTFVIDEESIDEVAIYATKADALAAQKAAENDKANAGDEANKNKPEANTEGDTPEANTEGDTPEGNTEGDTPEANAEGDTPEGNAPEGNGAADGESGVTITPNATEGDTDKAPDAAPGDPATDVLTVTLDASANGLGVFQVYVKKDAPFGTATYDPEGKQPAPLSDFALGDPTGETAFEGWETADGITLTDDFVVTQDITVTPVFVPVQPDPSFQVKFDANGHGKAPAAQTIVSNGYLDTTGLTLSAKNYEFGGWYTEPECTNWFDTVKTPITGDITLYAKWTKLCTVTFDLNGYGTNPMPAIQVPQGQCIAQGVETPTDPNMTFQYWHMGDGKTYFVPATTPVDKDMTVYAYWLPKVSIENIVDTPPSEVPTFDLVIAKMNKDDGTSLEGAEFTLKDKAGNVIGSWTSGKAGVMVKGLRQDTTYVLHETKAPAGFGIEKPININYTSNNGVETVNIDQDTGNVIPLTKNDDGISVLNVLDSNGKKRNTTGTTMPPTGDSQSLPLAGICFGAAALVAAGVAFAAYRKKKQ